MIQRETWINLNFIVRIHDKDRSDVEFNNNDKIEMRCEIVIGYVIYQRWDVYD